MFRVGKQGPLLQDDRGSTILWCCHLNMWLPESPYSPALHCSHSEVTHIHLLLPTHYPEAVNDSWEISWALLALPQGARVSHSRSEGAFSGRSFKSDILWECRLIVSSQGWARVQEDGGEQGLYECWQPAAPPLPSSSLNFWVTLSCNLGFPPTWAWVWGWGGRRPSFIKFKWHISCRVTDDNNLHRKHFKIYFAKVSRLCIITTAPWKWEMETDMTWRIGSPLVISAG